MGCTIVHIKLAQIKVSYRVNPMKSYIDLEAWKVG